MADILLGNVKGPQGEEGRQGEQGERGSAATINVGTVSTTAYGNTAQVINSGTEQDAVLDFVIPQGKPGEQTTRMGALTLDTITAQSADFPIPAVGETGSTVFGKIIKFFNSTISALNSKLNISDVVNNLTSTSTTQPLSAAQGKALNDAKVSIDGRWFGFTNSNAPSGYRAISTHIKHTSLCPLLYCDEAGTIFILYNFAASTPPSTISVLTPYYIHDAGNIQQVVWVADTSYGGTVRIKVVYKQYLVRGGWMSLNGRAQFLMQTYADS